MSPNVTRTGYEISFLRYFYKPQELRSLEEIHSDTLVLERETEGLLEQLNNLTRNHWMKWKPRLPKRTASFA